MSKEAKAIQTYLQNECSDYWHVKEKQGIIECYYIDAYRFSLSLDDDNWRISGIDIDCNIIYNIAIILGENY